MRKRERDPKKDRGIFKRPKASGIWWIRFHDENGQEHREKVGPKALARDVYSKRKTEVRERRFFPELIRRRDKLVADAITEYLTTRKDEAASYRDLVRIGNRWTAELTGKTLRQVKEADVVRYRQARREEVSEQTVIHELSFLRRVFRRAIEHGYADRNPVGKLRRPANDRVRYLSTDEEDRLRNKLSAEDWKLVAMAMSTGMRRGELFGLRREYIDFANHVINIPKTKNGHGRKVVLNDDAVRILHSIPVRLGCPYIFANEAGTNHVDAHNFVKRTFNPAVEAAGIEDLHWHDLRHTFASRLVMAGVPIATVRDLLGHRTIQTTMRYAHLSEGHKLEAVQRLNEYEKRHRTGTTTGTRKGRDV